MTKGEIKERIKDIIDEREYNITQIEKDRNCLVGQINDFADNAINLEKAYTHEIIGLLNNMETANDN